MHIITAGLNHRTAPVEVRERIAFRESHLPDALRSLRERPGVAEAAILSTCNRAELYAASPAPERAVDELASFLGEFHDLDPAAFRPHLYLHTDAAAARHLFRVAVGLDSMVFGEGQILGQVRHALQSAAEHGSTQTVLNELFQRSLHLGKRARTETAICRGAVSISSAAVDLAKDVFGELRGREALIIGAGEMSEQTLKHLVGQGVGSVVVANRTYSRAVGLAACHGGCAITFEEFPRHLAQADIVVSSSAAPHPILTAELLRPVLTQRRGRPLFIIDIAVPRDVETAVADLPNVYLFDIDDLQSVAEKYRRQREQEAAAVERMVDDETQRFMGWLSARDVTPLIGELRERTDALRDAELERWMRKLGDLDARQQDVVRQMMRSFANKLLHTPLTQMRQITRDHPQDIETVRRLFDLEGVPDEAVAERRSKADGDSA